MEDNTYKFKSYNTLEHMDFHDCIIKKTELYNKTLYLYFDWVNILKTHPDNGIEDFKETNNAVIRFDKIKVRKGQWNDMSKAVANANEREKKQMESGLTGFFKIEINEIEIKDIDFLDALNKLNITSFDITRTRKKYICKMTGDIIGSPPLRIVIEFEYADAYICFN